MMANTGKTGAFCVRGPRQDTVKCFANCTAEQIAASVGLTTKDLFLEDSVRSTSSIREIEKTYDYTDESENLLFR
jgi:hypothetical protein